MSKFKMLMLAYSALCIMAGVSASKEPLGVALATGAAYIVIVPGVIVGTVLGHATPGPVWGLSLVFWLGVYLYRKMRRNPAIKTDGSAPAPRVALVRRMVQTFGQEE